VNEHFKAIKIERK